MVVYHLIPYITMYYTGQVRKGELVIMGSGYYAFRRPIMLVFKTVVLPKTFLQMLHTAHYKTKPNCVSLKCEDDFQRIQ